MISPPASVREVALRCHRMSQLPIGKIVSSACRILHLATSSSRSRRRSDETNDVRACVAMRHQPDSMLRPLVWSKGWIDILVALPANPVPRRCVVHSLEHLNAGHFRSMKPCKAGKVKASDITLRHNGRHIPPLPANDPVQTSSAQTPSFASRKRRRLRAPTGSLAEINCVPMRRRGRPIQPSTPVVHNLPRGINETYSEAPEMQQGKLVAREPRRSLPHVQRNVC